MKEELVFYSCVLVIVGLFLLWAVYAYTDFRARWNIAHLKNCPCITEVQK